MITSIHGNRRAVPSPPYPINELELVSVKSEHAAQEPAPGRQFLPRPVRTRLTD